MTPGRMSKRIGIIGYPIRHSISPIFQQAALDYFRLDATFEAWEVEPKELPEFIKGLRSPSTLGINVTVPHKEAVMGHLDHIDEWSKTAGAVNTVVNEKGKLTGYNTDGLGFLRALKDLGQLSPKGCKVLIFGAGGSAKAVGLALAREGVASITIANRTAERARHLADLLRVRGPEVEVVPFSWSGDALVRAAGECDLLVNCTTLGMKHGPAEDASPIASRYIPSGALVYDLVYNPPQTPLLLEAAMAGASSLGGLPMLVYQGVAAFKLWTGREAPVDLMMKAAQGALA